jgi:hypothetical protein
VLPFASSDSTVALPPQQPARRPANPVGYGNPSVACELEVRSSLGFRALTLFVYVEAHLILPKLAYLTLCRSIQLLALLGCGDASKDLEILVLRHQLSVLRRQVPRPRLEPADRVLLAAVSRVLPRVSWSCLFVKPDTLLRWHRRLVAGAWPYPRGAGRPPLDQQVSANMATSAGGHPTATAVSGYDRYFWDCGHTAVGVWIAVSAANTPQPGGGRPTAKCRLAGVLWWGAASASTPDQPGGRAGRGAHARPPTPGSADHRLEPEPPGTGFDAAGSAPGPRNRAACRLTRGCRSPPRDWTAVHAWPAASLRSSPAPPPRPGARRRTAAAHTASGCR